MTTLTVDAVDQTDYLQDRSLRFKLQTLDFTLIDPATEPVMGDVVEVDDPPWLGTITTRELNPYHSVDADHLFVKVTATNNTVATYDTAPFNLSDAPDEATTFGYSAFSLREQMNEGVLERRLSCRVFEPGLRPGMEVTIENGAADIFNLYTIVELDVGFPTDTDPTFDIECSEGTFAEAIPPVTLNDVIDSSGGACRLGTAVPDTTPTAYYGEMYAGGVSATLVGDPDEEVTFMDGAAVTPLKFVEGSALVIVGSHLVIPASVVPNAGLARVTEEIGDARIYARIQCDTNPVPAYSSTCAATLAWTEDAVTGTVTFSEAGPLASFDDGGTGGSGSGILDATPNVLLDGDYTLRFTLNFHDSLRNLENDLDELLLRIHLGGLYGVGMRFIFRNNEGVGSSGEYYVRIGDTETPYQIDWVENTDYVIQFVISGGSAQVDLVGYDGNAGTIESGSFEARADIVIIGNAAAHYDITVSVDDFCTVTP